MRSRLVTLVLYVAVAAASIFVVSADTLHYGFNYDDYHFVRPYSAGEVLAAFQGPWDATGIEVPFFRPLTVAFFAMRFELFGLNAEAYHAISLVMFGLAAVLAGLLVSRFMSSAAAGAFAVLAVAVHPSMPYAAAAWITNQMHLLELILVLFGMLWWYEVRRRRAVWWLPLLLFQVASFLVKEDGIMLVPAILALHLLRRTIAERDLPAPPYLFLISAAAVGAAMISYRAHVLHGLGGYGVPTLEQAWSNYARGFTSVFRLLPPRRPWQWEASWFVTLAPLVALACWLKLTANARFAIAAALAIGLLFNLPFVFVVKAQQMHLVALGASLLIVASVLAASSAVSSGVVRAVLGLVAALGMAAMTIVARDITSDFEPFGKLTLGTDAIVREWAAVPAELRDYLERKLQPDAAARLSSNPAEAVDVVSYGFHSLERSPDGRSYRWMAGPIVELDVTDRARLLEIPFRHEAGAFREATTATVQVDGRILDRIAFSSGDWRVSSVPLRPATAGWLRRMHRVVISIDHGWIPASIIPGSQDYRMLGLQVGELTIR